MALAHVQSGQSAAAANSNSSTFGSALTAGDTIVVMASQSGSTLAPSLSGYVVNPTGAVYNTTDSTWAMYKIATGGETGTGTITPGSGGTVRGNAYIEVSGAAASVTLDGTLQTASGSGLTGSVAYTTSTPGSMVILGVGQNAASGVLGAWSGTNVATNFNTGASTRFQGGYFITGSTISSTFTANWANSHVFGMVALAISPPAAAAGTVSQRMIRGMG